MFIRYHELYWQMGADCRGLLSTLSIHVLEPSGTFNLGVSLRTICSIRRVEYEMAHCVLLEHTHHSHLRLNQTKGDASGRLLLAMTKILVFSFVRKGPFRFALLYCSVQSRLLGASRDAFALPQIFSIVPCVCSKSAERFRTGIMSILISVAEEFWC